MATTIILPDNISSDTGFDSTGATLLGLINDSDEGTGVTQNNVTANATMTFQNGAYSGTINSVTTSITAQTSGRATSTTITIKLMDGDGTTLQSDSHVINNTDGSITKSNDAYTTNLSVGLVDGLQATITPWMYTSRSIHHSRLYSGSSCIRRKNNIIIGKNNIIIR